MRRWYFSIASLLLLALTLVGFSDNLITNVGQPSNRDPKFIVHGLLCGAWMILFAVQANLAGARNLRWHRTFGIGAFVIAIGVTLSTVFVFWAVWKGWAAMTPEVKANRLLLPSFSVAVLLGWLNRRRPEWHKRYVYVGTLFMMEPVLGRAYDPMMVPLMSGWSVAQVDFAFLPWLFAVWLGFFLSLAVYDRVVLRRLHPVTVGGVVWFGAVWAIAGLS